MAQNQMVPPMVSVTGFIALILGSMGYMGVFAMTDVISYILMTVGLIAVIGGMAAMMLINRSVGDVPEEE